MRASNRTMADRSVYVQDDRLVWAPATVLQQSAGKLVVKARRPANDASLESCPVSYTHLTLPTILLV